MQLIPGEQVLYTSPSGHLTLTTHRIRYEQGGRGAATIKSIMLEEVASCAIAHVSYPGLLTLAVLLFIASMFGAREYGFGVLVLGFIGAAGLVLIYLRTREQTLAIASAGTTIRVNTRGTPLARIRGLVDQIEEAKNARYLMRQDPRTSFRS